MTEQTEQYDATQHSIPDVKAHLDALPEGQRAAEATRIVEAEKARTDDTEPRAGILALEPQEAPSEPESTQAPDKSPEGVQAARDAQQADAAAKGFLGDQGETPKGTEPVKPVAEAAPEGVDTDASAGFVVSNVDDVAKYTQTGSPTMSDQKAPRLQGEHYRQGFLGDVPSVAAGEDLTLSGVLRAQYGDPDSDES